MVHNISIRNNIRLLKKKEKIVEGIRSFFRENNFSRAVIGISGGIDSAVTAALAVEALGNNNVIGLLLHDKTATSDESRADAQDLIDNLNIHSISIEINDILDSFMESAASLHKDADKSRSSMALANTKARIRMALLYYYANANNAIVLGTADRSEAYLGYATKFGDAAADIMPIAGLWKTEVRDIGSLLGIPENIIRKRSSPELIRDTGALEELGADYDVIDPILRLHVEEGMDAKQIIANTDYPEQVVSSILRRIPLNRHKNELPFVIKFS